MNTHHSSRDQLVLLPALAPADGQAIMQALDEAGMAGLQCNAANFLEEANAGVGVIVLSEASLTDSLIRDLARLIDTQPIWSDIPLVILTAAKKEASRYWVAIRNTPAIRNATFLERPMSITTLIQSINVALRGREKQYRLRDQMKESELLLARSERDAQQLSAVLNNTKLAVFFMDDRQHCTFMNQAAEKMTGYTLDETSGHSLHDVIHHTHPDGKPYPLENCPIDRAFPENNQTEGEEVFVHKDGHFYPVAFTASPIRNGDSIVGTVIEVRDIAKEKADIARIHMMMNELNHRVKNTLATVQSIFVQTLDGESVSETAKERVMSRLMALSRSHDLLTEQSWISASLPEIVYRALVPFGATHGDASRFTFSGPDVEFSAKPALALAMGLHELATNAVKHGALSVDAGRVDVSWKMVNAGILQIRWVERGGPLVTPPEHKGFGRRLIERGLAHELGGAVRISFNPEGVTCEIDIPAETAMAIRM